MVFSPVVWLCSFLWFWFYTPPPQIFRGCSSVIYDCTLQYFVVIIFLVRAILITFSSVSRGLLAATLKKVTTLPSSPAWAFSHVLFKTVTMLISLSSCMLFVNKETDLGTAPNRFQALAGTFLNELLFPGYQYSNALSNNSLHPVLFSCLSRGGWDLWRQPHKHATSLQLLQPSFPYSSKKNDS